MDFDKFVNGADITVMYVLFGGPTPHFDGMSSIQQSVFFKEMMEVPGAETDSIENLYLKHIHDSGISVPRYVHVANKDGEIYSAPIVSLEQAMMNIREKVHGEIYMWCDKYRLEKHLEIYKMMTGANIYPASIKQLHEVIKTCFFHEDLEELMAIACMHVDPIKNVQQLLNEGNIARLKNMCEFRTSFMLKLAGC